MIKSLRTFWRVRTRTTIQHNRMNSRLFAVITALFVGMSISGCSAGNFRWYSPTDARKSEPASRYTGDSKYASKYLTRKQLYEDDPLLVEIDDSISIRASDLLTRLEESYLLKTGGTVAWDQVADTLEYLLTDTLVSLAADTFQLRQDSASWGDFSLVRDALLGKLFLNEVIYAQTPVDSLEVDSFYFARPDIFTYYAQVNLGHIVLSKGGYRSGIDSAKYAAIPDDELDSLIFRRLRFLKEVITDSSMFEELANKYSQDRRTGDHGGRLGWVERYNLHPEIEDVLYDENTPLHTAIGPLESRDGVHLFYLYDRHFKGIPPLNEKRYRQAYNYVLGAGAKDVYAQVRDSLRAEHPSTFNDSVLELSARDTSPSAPVAWASGIDTVRFETYDRARGLLRSKLPFDKVLTIEQLRSVAQGLVDTRLTLLMAQDIGLADNPDFIAAVKKESFNFARAAVRRKSRDPEYKPTDEEINQYFHEHQSEYAIDKPVRIQQIVFSDSLKAEFVRALAESGEDFLELADTYYPGDTAIRRDAANLGYIGPDDFERTIFTTAMRGSVGDVTPPIKTQYGYHIVKILDVKRGVSVTENRSSIIKELDRLHNERVKRQWVQSLHKGHKIVIAPVRYRGVVMGAVDNRAYLPYQILPPGLKDSQP